MPKKGGQKAQNTQSIKNNNINGNNKREKLKISPS
jgi:hypothetical protein